MKAWYRLSASWVFIRQAPAAQGTAYVQIMTDCFPATGTGTRNGSGESGHKVPGARCADDSAPSGGDALSARVSSELQLKLAEGDGGALERNQVETTEVEHIKIRWSWM
jgi:hypothetical protein